MTDCSFAGEQKKEMRHRPHARAPEGTRIYAIGDMHGRLDLLQKLEGKIQADADSSGAAIRIAVYLGDYIDRGPDSRALIDWLIEGHLDGFETHLLKGNHEDRMLKYLEGPNGGKRWLAIGGLETLQSYGISASTLPSLKQGDQWRKELIRQLPPEHMTFLSNLEIKYECGDYLFVHAGVKPGVALEDQNVQDFLWIRDEFLGSTEDFGRMVVHGHSIGATPQIQSNRICVDTGAYYSGHLTAAVLEGDEVWFLQT